MVCDKVMCEVIVKLCVKFVYVKDGMWQNCVLSLCVWSYWKIVCDKVVF